MKRLFFVIILSSLITSMQAQDSLMQKQVQIMRPPGSRLTYGIGAGIDISDMTYKPAPGFYNSIYPNPKLGFNANAFLGVALNDKYWVQTELGYYGLGSKINNAGNGINGQNEITEINYLTFALLGKWVAKGTGLGFYIGPSIGLKLSSSAELVGDLNPNQPVTGVYAQNDYKSVDVFGILGAEYFFPKGYGMSFRYMQGLSNVAGESYGDGKVFNRSFVFSLAYRFMK